MSRVQKAAVATTVLLSALDGYDVLSVTFAAPAITREWIIGKAELGIVLSAGLAGMAAGSFLLAPLADVFGRRLLILGSLLVLAFGSLGTSLAGSIDEISIWRVVTGLGIGTCIAVINPTAAEFSNARSRPLAIALMALGYPVGGLLGGLLAALIMPVFGWRALFKVGFAAALVLLVITLMLLPESPSYLASRRGPHNLTRLNHLLQRCKLPAVTAPLTASGQGRGYAGVFARDQIAITLRLAAINTLVASVSYYVLSWLPQLVSDAGFSASTGSLISAVLSLAGIGGGLLVAFLAKRIGQARSTGFAITGLGLTIAVLGVATSSLTSLLVAAALCGGCLFGSAAGFYGVLAAGYRDEDRAAGSGFVIGTGRISSALAPLLAGYCFALGFDRGAVSAAFGLAALAAASLLFLHSRRGAR